MLEANVKWDTRFLLLACHFATWSKDRSTKVGAVVVGPDREIVTTGYNGFPPGVDDDAEDRHTRPTKYFFTEHAERNAIFFAAARGTSLAGCTIYVTSHPCSDCARGIIRAGIKRVVFPQVVDPANLPKGDWAEHMRIAGQMFLEAGVAVHTVDLGG